MTLSGGRRTTAPEEQGATNPRCRKTHSKNKGELVLDMSGGNTQEGRNFSTNASAVSPAVQDLGNIGGRDPQAQRKLLLVPSPFQKLQPNFLDPFWAHSYNPANLLQPFRYSKKV